MILIDISRKSKHLGNPFVMKSEKDRDQVCDQFEEYFENDLRHRAPVISILSDIKRRSDQGRRIALVCWCWPKRCHGLTYLKALDSKGKTA